jgi:hypothetical protein
MLKQITVDMKNIVIIILFAFISATSFSQKNPPETVKKEFSKKYPAAQKVKWDNEEKNEWEAEFTLNGKSMTTSFDNSGRWVESETKMAEKDLPASVLHTLSKDFLGYKTGEIEMVENTESKGYELGLQKGDTSIEVVINNKGKIIKQTDLKKEGSTKGIK